MGKTDIPGHLSTHGTIPRLRQEDRRARPTRFYDSIQGYHRRRAGRRRSEKNAAYVDHYGLGDLLLVVGILTLNIADAFFTLQWVGRGGSEGNPLMKWVLENGGTEAFVIQKCLLVGFWLLLLVVHKNFRIARIGLWTLLVLYSTLLLYHLFLYFFGVPILPVSA